MRKLSVIFTTLILGAASHIYAQAPNGIDIQKDHQLQIFRTHSPITIDGEFNEAAWDSAGVADDFWVNYPNDQSRASQKTEVKVLFDDNNIYFAFTVHDSANVVIQSLKRDLGHDNNDAVAIVLDPLNKRQNGFWFVLNAYNAQSEDQLHFGTAINYSWDNKWFSATKRYPNKWTAEIAIPFKTLRYTTDKKLWGINFVRVDQKTYEYSTWTHVPVSYRTYDLGYTGALVWNETPPKPGNNIVLLPYVTGGANQDKQNNVPTKGTFNAGFDGKLAVTPALNLDLTVNPDFSQVEVDQEVTNLTRYNIFLPEKRAFFLENSEIFGGFGAANFIQPFYSRSIGLDKDGNKIPIIGGARLSGNVTKSTRIGIMNMQTADHGDYHAENFTAVSVHQNLFSRSVLKGYFLDRQSFQPDSLNQKDPLSKWGRNAGMEFDYSNLTGSFVATASYNQSFKPGIIDKNKYVEASATYLGRHFSFQLDGLSVGTNYYTDMGYVQRISNYDALRDTSIRVGFTQLYGELNYKVLPSKGGIGQHVIDLTSIVTLNPDNSFNERTHTLKYLISFKNTSSFSASAIVDEVNLLYPINFTTTGKPLPAAHYNFTQGLLTYASDIRKPFSLTVNAGGGYFYNGTIQTISGSINWRNQPHINLAIQAEYDKLQFPGQYSSAEIYLVSPKIEIDFSTKIFWTTYLQYNTQQNNYNINSRFQYRFRPMSDIYLVYTDNYFTNPNLKNKNRAVVFKMNYWLNL